MEDTCHFMLVWIFFSNGLNTRMGQTHKPNLGLSVGLIVKMEMSIIEDVKLNQEEKERFNLISVGSYLVISCVLSLRGDEGLMLDLSRLVEEMDWIRKHVMLPLKGKVKGEALERDHIFPCVKKTKSGLDMELWIKLLITGYKSAERFVRKHASLM